MDLRWVVLWAVCLGACHGGPILDVTVIGVPGDTQRLKLAARIRGQEEPWVQPLSGRPARFDANLPLGTRGRGTLKVGAIGPLGCQTAEGVADFEVDANNRYPLTVALKERAGCSVTLTQNLELGVAPGRILGMPVQAGCAGPSCTYKGRLSEVVQLLPHPELDVSFFSGWLGNGICRSAGLCKVELGEDPLEVTYAFLPGQVCKDGFCWERPRPQGSWLTSVWAASQKEVWAVGARGAVMRYDGLRWLPYQSGTNEDLEGVHGVRPALGRSASDVWIVGGHGTVLHWDGQRLRSVDVGTKAMLWQVWANSPSEVWVAGWDGTLLRGDGESFVPMETRVSTDFKALWSAGPSRPIFVGGEAGFLRQWNGNGWISHDLPVTEDVRSLTGGGGVIWALVSVDRVNKLSAQLWRSEGGSDFVLRHKVDEANALFSPPGSERVYGAGEDGIIWSLIDKKWVAIYREGELFALSGIGGTSDDDLWVVGEGGLIWHWAGTSWLALDPLPPTAFYSIHGSASVLYPDAYVSVGGVKGRLLGRTGLGHWITLRAPNDTILGLWVAGRRDFWMASGDLTHVSENNTRLISFRDQNNKAILGVYGLSPTSVWAVGSQGLIVHSDGAKETIEPSGTTVTLRAIWGDGPDNLWAAGDKGTIVRRLGGTWQRFLSVAEAGLFLSIWGSGPNNVWFVGESALALHWNGVQLRGVALPARDVQVQLTSVWTSGPDDVWIGGNRLWHYDGGKWDVRDPVGIGFYTGLWGHGRPSKFHNVYAITSSGGILHYQGGAQ